jgi:hypothetical protein
MPEPPVLIRLSTNVQERPQRAYFLGLVSIKHRHNLLLSIGFAVNFAVSTSF